MSQRIEVVLDDQGRLVLPSLLQHRLGLSTGMALVVERETEDAAYLRVQSEEPPMAERQGVLVVQSRPLADLTDAARSGRDLRVAELLGRAGV